MTTKSREGRSKSLGASLGYGFASAFDDNERKQLAVLHLFQGFVDVQVLQAMGHPESEWCLDELRELTCEDGIALLSRAAQVGLLTEQGGGYYSIHPVLPWYFRRLFNKYYGQRGEAATRAFVEAIGQLGEYYLRQYSNGNREIISAIAAEEANLLHARCLARTHGWWISVIHTMQGLSVFYRQTGRLAEWKRLVDEIVPDFVHPDTNLPLPGREGHWSLVTEYRVELARNERRWEEAGRLQSVCVDWNRQGATDALKAALEALNDQQRNRIRSLAVAVTNLGQIQREQENVACVTAYEESIELYHRIGDKATEAISAFSLGRVYTELSAIRDLPTAETWCRRSLSLIDENDGLGRGKCLNQLGYVAWERFKKAQEAGLPEVERLGRRSSAIRRLPCCRKMR